MELLAGPQLVDASPTVPHPFQQVPALQLLQEQGQVSGGKTCGLAQTSVVHRTLDGRSGQDHPAPLVQLLESVPELALECGQDLGREEALQVEFEAGLLLVEVLAEEGVLPVLLPPGPKDRRESRPGPLAERDQAENVLDRGIAALAAATGAHLLRRQEEETRVEELKPLW
jgi:hypothetical protein